MLKSSAFMNPFFLSSQSGLTGGAFSSGPRSAVPAGVPGENLFAMLLAKTKPGQAFAGSNHAGASFSPGSAANHASVLPGGQKHGINDGPAAAFLESVFLSQGISPDKVALSRKDLDFLSNVLAKMGFSRSQSASFFKAMEEARSDGFITLSHFFKDLSAFEQNEIRKTDLLTPSLSEPLSLDKSAVPHLELILRDLGFSPEKVNDLLSAASLKTGAIDIGKLVFQLKSRMDSKSSTAGPSPTPNQATTQMGYLKEKNAGGTQVPDQNKFLSKGQNKVPGSVPETGEAKTDPMSRPEETKAPVPEPPSIQRVASGLEKLGLPMPNKPPHHPFTLEMLIRSLEKKNSVPVQASKPMAMDSAAMAETVQEMPAVKTMKMEKADTYFGFAREMMMDRQNKPAPRKSASQLSGPRDPLSANTADTAIREQALPKSDSRISVGDVSAKSFVDRSDAGPRPSRLDHLKQDAEKTAAVSRGDTDSRPMPADFTRTDGRPGQESHQTLMPGGDRVHGQTMTFAAGAQEVFTPAKPLGVPQQGPLPAVVMNQVGKEIASFLQRGERIFTLQLKPPELGMVTIEMDVRENVLKMSVVAETSSAKDMLHANYVDLRRVLEGFGVRVESFDVQLSGNLSNHASANGDGALNQQAHSHGRFGKNMQAGRQAGDTAGEDDIDLPGVLQPGKDGLLDLLA